MAHAFEADHLAAMGGLAAKDRTRGWRDLVSRGCAWGLGHTITLFLICGAVILLGAKLTPIRESQLEFAVGVMLVALGAHVLWRLWRDRVHFHLHQHRDSDPHFHAHSHKNSNHAHGDDAHDHSHRKRALAGPLIVGLMHGMAGSAGLLAIAAASTQSASVALGYVLIFGIGSILGMGLLSLMVYWPLHFAENSANVLHRAIIVVAGLVAIGVGASVMVGTAPLAFGGVAHA
jgi:cytochrome c biogenesis protein CcdA